MIPAKKNRFFQAWFVSHVEGRLFRSFSRIEVLGLVEARRAVAEGPVMFVANHSTWWDGLVALYISTRVLGVDAYAMMNATNLRRVPFFARVGAFGVDLDDAADGAHSIRYAARLLDRAERVVWIFPQGEERSPYAPLVLRPGAAQIARVTGKRGARIVPVGLRYVFRGDEKAHLSIAFGPSEEPLIAIDAGVAQQRSGIEAALARIDRSFAEEDEGGHGDPDRSLLRVASPGLVARLAERFLARLFPAPVMMARPGDRASPAEAKRRAR